MATPVQASVQGRQAPSPDRPWLIGLAVLVVIGIVAWIAQLAAGFDVLGVGQSIAWGVYIATFFLLAGAGSGLLLGSATTDLGFLPEMAEHRRSLLVGALACYIAAGFAVLMDIGQPLRALEMIYSPNFKSMFVWDFYLLGLSVILTLVCLLRRPGSKRVAGLAAAAAVLLLLVEGAILAVTAGTPLWHSGLIPVMFLVEGVVTAISLVLLKRGAATSSGERMRRTLTALLPVLLVCTLVEMVAVLYGGDADAAAAMKMLAAGSFAPMYWGQLVLGIVVPFAIFAGPSVARGNIRVAAVLAIAGVFVAKMNLLVAGRALPFMGTPTSYTPSVVEIGGLIGLVGLAALLYVLGKRVLPLQA